MEQQIAEGDRVEVDIVNNCPLGGSVQMSSFTVESVAINEVSGSSDWCDSHTITGFGTDSIEYSDAGKSGEVAEVRVMETGDDGVTIHGSGTVVA